MCAHDGPSLSLSLSLSNERTAEPNNQQLITTAALDFLRHRVLCSGPSLLFIALLMGAAAYSFAARVVAADAAAAERMSHLLDEF